MADMHFKPSCFVHFEGENGSLSCFTDISLEKFLECHKLWLELDGEQREIAHNTTKIVEDIKKNGNRSSTSGNLYYLRN